MEIESVKATGSQTAAAASTAVVSETPVNPVKAVAATKKAESSSNDSGNGSSQNPESKKVAQSTIENTMSEVNSKIKLSNTQLRYSIDEETQRISIKVIDQQTDKVIREIPPEETLEAIKKIWEIAGIIVDEKL